jgi:hypothetical protein
MGDVPFVPFIFRNKTADKLWPDKVLLRHARVLGATPEMTTVLRALAERHTDAVTAVLRTPDPVARANLCAVVEELERWMILLHPRFAPRLGDKDDHTGRVDP